MAYFIPGVFFGAYMGMVVLSLIYVARERNWDRRRFATVSDKPALSLQVLGKRRRS